MVKVSPAADCHVEGRLSASMPADCTGTTWHSSPIPPRRRADGRHAQRRWPSLVSCGDLASIAGPSSQANENFVPADADVLVVLADAALWAAGGQPPIATNAPPSVELVTYVKRDRMAVFILNGTLIDSRGVIRYVIPCRTLRSR